ncbi:HTH-type transcriptional repressor YvoA [Clostridia bacterium]|nr:HTH-type transcriptional repressor YvoA [Clostridia bacterium]
MRGVVMAKREDDLPLYKQVKTSILERIQNSQMTPGDVLPTEAELEEEYSVSRTTIRAAISELQSEGYIIKQQGRGTFVANNSYEDCTAVLQSFTKDAQNRGITMRTILISRDLMVPPDDVLEYAASKPDMFLRLQRLRYIDDVPTILTTSYLPRNVYEKLDWKNVDFCENSLYSELEAVGIDMESGEELLEVVNADIYEASLLQVDIGYILGKTQRNVFDKQGCLVEHGCSLTRGDQYRLYIKLKKR